MATILLAAGHGRVEALDAKAFCRQRRDDLGGMAGTVGFDGDVDTGAFRRHVQHGAMVGDLEDVAAGLADGAGDFGEHARPVADDDAHGDDALLAGELADHDRGGKPRIDVAAGKDEPDAASAEAGGIGEHGGEAGGAGALGHGLLEHEIGGDGLLDSELGHQHDVVDMAANDFQRQRADVLDGDALGERLAADPRRLAVEGRAHGGIHFGFDADDLHVRLERLDRDGNARNQAAAADRHDDRFEVRAVGDDLEADGALSGNDMRVVIGMDEHRAAAGDGLLHDRLAIGDCLAVDDHLRAEGAGGGDLHEGRWPRHDDGCRDAKPLGVPGDRLGVVAGGHGNDAAGAFVGRKRQQLDQRAAFLERGGRLQVLVFDPDVGAGEVGQARGGQERRAHHHAGNLSCGGMDVGEGREADGIGHSGRF